jgi:hypothetical protein
LSGSRIDSTCLAAGKIAFEIRLREILYVKWEQVDERGLLFPADSKPAA